MAMRLEFSTQDPQEIELAKRYWAMDEDGAFLEPVADLLPFREITQPGALAKRVREFCRAYAENLVCRECSGELRISGRSVYVTMSQRSSPPCDDCQERLRDQLASQESASREEFEAKLATLIERSRNVVISYANLGDDEVLILQAIEALVGPKLLQGSFGLQDCDDLTPMGSDGFVMRLFTKGVLFDVPAAAEPGVYYLKEGVIWMKGGLVQFTLPPDEAMGGGEAAFDVVRHRKFSNAEALTSLWLDYSVMDVMRYLDFQCSLHGQELGAEGTEKVERAVRHGLRTYSVAQLWSIVWKVSKDAAALASRAYYNREKATLTIPSKIRKLLENADNGYDLRNEWKRIESHNAGSLGTLFTANFGLNEYSKGADVLKLFDSLGREGIDAECESPDLATAFMKSAVSAGKSAQALEAFADLIRAGLPVQDALEETISRNSDLFQ